MILFVDPGLRCCGLALFRGDGLFLRAGLARNIERTARGPKAWRAMADAVEAWLGTNRTTVTHIVCEVPQVYAGAKSGGDPADLLELAGVDGAICGVLQPETLGHYVPRAWKGTVDADDVMTPRISAAFTPAEHARIEACPASLRHNVLDACGIGLFYFKRLNVPTIRRG